MPELTLKPSFEYDVTTQFAVLQSRNPVMVQRRVINEHQPRRLRLQYKILTAPHLKTLRDLFAECRGRAGTFTYTPVDEVTPAQWRFTADKLDYLFNNAVVRSASIEIEEDV
ncbi:MAG TPA: hypothetical protein VEL28_21055 [Candidatus Binatia bacterium]|nr:hypothetical protein [Candidatus Binatia bacterium]